MVLHTLKNNSVVFLYNSNLRSSYQYIKVRQKH